MPLRISLGFPRPQLEGGSYQRSRSKMAKIWSILYIVYSLEVGSFLIMLPWFQIWEENYLLFLYPGLRPWVANPFLKGAVLGLGIVNLLIGLHEIVHFRKGPGDYFSR